MVRSKRTVLKISLTERDFSFKTIPKVEEFIGGQPLANYLLNEHLLSSEKDLIYFSVVTGPLNGVFPYTSKSIFTHLTDKLKLNTFIGGGKLGSLMNLSSICAIEFFGKSEKPIILDITDKNVRFLEIADGHEEEGLGLSGRRSRVKISSKEITENNHFSYGKSSEDLQENNLTGFVYSIDSEYSFPSLYNFEQARKKVLEKENALLVSRGSYPSCHGCPVGCAFSKNPENKNVSILPRSLVSCEFAEPIYNDINLVFSCLSSLGYSYNHEFLEKFPAEIGELNKELKDNLEKIRTEKNFITKIK